MKSTNAQVHTSTPRSDGIITAKVMLLTDTYQTGHIFKFSFNTFCCFATTHFTEEFPANAEGKNNLRQTVTFKIKLKMEDECGSLNKLNHAAQTDYATILLAAMICDYIMT